MIKILKNRARVFIVIVLMMLQGGVRADVLVRINVQVGISTPEFFNARLFDEVSVAPNTVNNFLNYAAGTTLNGGSYDNVFFHRTVTNFIVQTGGFLYDPLNGDFTYDAVNDVFADGLDKVITDDPIAGEFKLSNTLGTIAMAKLPTDPNSATSQWFINLKDNSANLDSQNGGFTVFGEVMGSGMDVVNNLAAILPVDKTDIHPAFGGLPLVNYFANEAVDKTKLIKIVAIDELVTITGDIDFGLQFASTSSQRTVFITNVSDSGFNMGATGASDGLLQPFSIVSGTDTCSGIMLPAGASCSFDIDYRPAVEGDFADSLIIDFPDLGINYTLSVSGSSAIKIEPDITSDPVEVDYGEVGIVLDATNVLPTQIVVQIFNEGNADLNITSAELSGPDVAFFNVFDNCKIVSPIAPGDSCVLPVNLFPTEVGIKNAVLTVFSDDPDSPVLEVPIRASISMDTDGVPAETEDNSALSSDGNFDNNPDSLQSHVVSFKGDNNRSVTLVTAPNIEFRNVAVKDVASLVSIPANVNFDFGAIEFNTTVKGGAPVTGFNVSFILPVDVDIQSLYLYGPTVDNTTPHWYVFNNDGSTGVLLISKVEFVTQNGATEKRRIVFLHLEDGARGDNDLLADTKVRFFGALNVKKSSSSGALSFALLLSLVTFLVLLRCVSCNSWLQLQVNIRYIFKAASV